MLLVSGALQALLLCFVGSFGNTCTNHRDSFFVVVSLLQDLKLFTYLRFANL